MTADAVAPDPGPPPDRSRTARPIVVRELRERDLDGVVAIELAANPQPWTRTLFAQELALPPASRHWLVAVERADGGEAAPRGGDRLMVGSDVLAGADDRVVGFAGLMFTVDEAHLMLIGVAGPARRRGIATVLCLGLFAEARSRGIRAVTLEVRASNAGAIALYRSLGMSVAGRRPRYYRDGEDAVILSLDDLGAALVTAQHRRLAQATAALAVVDRGGDRP